MKQLFNSLAVVGFVLGVTALVPSRAGGQEAPADTAVSTARVLPSQLNLNDAVHLALTNNVQLALALLDVMAAREDTEGAKAYKEVELVLEGGIEEGRRKNTVEQSVSLLSDTFEEENTRYSAALEGLLPIGTTYRVGYDVGELSNSLTNRTFRAPFESQFTTFAGVSVTQPLLRNFGLTVTRSRLINARLEEKIAEQNLRKQRMLTVANTVLAYWDVWMQQELVKERASSLKNARALQAANEQRKAEGKIAAIEVAAARAGVVKRETQWLEANSQYHESVNNLANLLGMEVASEMVQLDDPGVELQSDETLAVSDHLTDLGLRHPDVQIKDMEIEVGTLQLKVLTNQSRPELNLVGSYGHNGLGSDLSESNDDITDGDFDRWSVGLVFRMGLGGGQEMVHRTRKAKIELDRSHMARDYVKKEVENRLRTTLRKVRLLRDAVVRQGEAVKINADALDAEQKLLAAGKSKTARAPTRALLPLPARGPFYFSPQPTTSARHPMRRR